MKIFITLLLCSMASLAADTNGSDTEEIEQSQIEVVKIRKNPLKSLEESTLNNAYLVIAGNQEDAQALFDSHVRDPQGARKDLVKCLAKARNRNKKQALRTLLEIF